MTALNTDSFRGGGTGGSILAAGLTDPGKTREYNEDAFLICEELGLYAVTDGMGGAKAGEVASMLVAKVLPVEVTANLRNSGRASDRAQSLSPDTAKKGWPLAECLRRSIDDLNRRMFEQASQVDQLHGMGATVVACLIRNGLAALAHMGDSRAYLMREGMLERLTEDHALADTLLRLGQISKVEARKHPGRHVLTRYVGMEGDVGPDVGVLELRESDRLLFCSDGLTNMVHDRTIGDVLWSEPDLDCACAKLVQAANDAGGADNISILIVQYGRGPHGPRAGKKVVVRRAVANSLKHLEQTGDEQQIDPSGDAVEKFL